MSLKLALFRDFEVSSPFWIASSHLSDNVSVLKSWQSINPSLIVLKTTSKKGGLGKGHRKMDKIQDEESLYSDGEKARELLNYEYSKELLQKSLSLLPNTRIGSSILMEEDYSECLSNLKESHFFELNLKYSVRFNGHETISKFDHDYMKYGKIKSEISKFLDVFQEYPCFIKFTREIDWLKPVREFEKIMTLCREYDRVGIVIANTKKWIIPQSESGRYVDLKDGVIAGKKLFSETFNIISDIRNVVPEEMPIIATGGMNSVESIMDILRAGAKAVQLCTVFSYRGHGYYSYLVEKFKELQKNVQIGSYDEFLRYLHDKKISFVFLDSPFKYHPNFYEYPYFKELFKSPSLSMVIVYGRSFTRMNEPNFIERFKTKGWRTIIITMEPNVSSPTLIGASKSLNRDYKEVAQLIIDQHAYWIRLYQEYGHKEHDFRLYQHNKIPFHSMYLTDKQVLYVPYSLVGEPVIGNLPIYESDVDTIEYARLKCEFDALVNISRQIYPDVSSG